MAVLTRLYETPAQAREALSALQALDNPEIEASILGAEGFEAHFPHLNPGVATSAGMGIGAAVGGGTGLLAGLGALAIPGLGPIAAAGWLVSAAAGAIAGGVAGGAVGATAELGLSEEDAPVYAEVVKNGGILVSVRVPASYLPDVERVLDDVTALNVEDLRAGQAAGLWPKAEEAP